MAAVAARAVALALAAAAGVAASAAAAVAIRSVIIAGAGIGKAAALSFARKGARVALAARTESQLEETASLIEANEFDKKNGIDIQWAFKTGDVVKLRIFNNPKSFHPMNHPIHIHGQRFLVLEMDGVPTQNLVWKDTAIVPVGSTMDVLVDMSNPGDWMLHCHIAEHLEAGMMLGFSVRDEAASR